MGRLLSENDWTRAGKDRIDFQLDQFCCEITETLSTALGVADLNNNVLSLDVAETLERLKEYVGVRLREKAHWLVKYRYVEFSARRPVSKTLGAWRKA